MRLSSIVMTCALLLGLAGTVAASEGRPAEKSPDQQAQKEWLKGLKEAGPGDLEPSKPLMIDPEAIPHYLEDGTRLDKDAAMKMLMSGEYAPTPFINDSKEIKAFVLRPATEEQKKMMQAMGGPPPAHSDLVGKKAKPFSVKDIKGARWSLKQLRGKIVVVNFWFVECAPCVLEIPELNRLVDDYGDEDVVFLALANNDKSQLESFLKTHEFKYAVAPNCTSIAAENGVSGYPTHMIIGKDSKIAYFSAGFSPATVTVLKGELARLLGK